MVASSIVAVLQVYRDQRSNQDVLAILRKKETHKEAKKLEKGGTRSIRGGITGRLRGELVLLDVATL